jgi:hypothetical protein
VPSAGRARWAMRWKPVINAFAITPVADGVPTVPVVEVGDPGGDLDPCLGAGAEPPTVDVLDLDGGEGGLGDGVVEALSG